MLSVGHWSLWKENSWCPCSLYGVNSEAQFHFHGVCVACKSCAAVSPICGGRAAYIWMSHVIWRDPYLVVFLLLLLTTFLICFEVQHILSSGVILHFSRIFSSSFHPCTRFIGLILYDSSFYCTVSPGDSSQGNLAPTNYCWHKLLVTT